MKRFLTEILENLKKIGANDKNILKIVTEIETLTIEDRTNDVLKIDFQAEIDKLEETLNNFISENFH